MSSFFTWVGYIVFALWLLGSCNLIDFHVCIKDAGQCSKEAFK